MVAVLIGSLLCPIVYGFGILIPVPLSHTCEVAHNVEAIPKCICLGQAIWFSQSSDSR